MSIKGPGLNRRDFVKTAGSSMAVASAAASLKASPGATGMRKSRIAVVGTGARGIGMWGAPAVRDYSDRIKMVGLCDINKKRVEVAQRLIGSNISDMDGYLTVDEQGKGSAQSYAIPVFTDFDAMVKEVQPERVIVTTMDSAHARYVIRGMELGCDIICEKPLAVNEEQCQAILDSQKQHRQRNVTVTFNARYGASATKVKELLDAGEIGDLYSVDYAEYLDADHGTSYFRRWHGIKENSGSLLVHKASHHFDQLNWWIGSDPVEVSAYGELRRFGRNGPFRHANCRLCTHKVECPHYWDITKDRRLMDLYVACESEDGYFRDGCVFRHAINIYDTMSVQIRYANKVLVTYSLNAGVPLEGQFMVFNGSRGRIEVRNYARQPWQPPARAQVRLMRTFESESKLVPLEERTGSHGGSDRLIRDNVFIPESPDPLKRRAGVRAGVASSIIGIAAYRSIERQRPISIRDLVHLPSLEV